MKKPPCALRDAGLSPPPSKLRRYPVRIIIASSLILLIAIPIYIWRPEKRVVKAHMRTSIGIYTGQDPFRWRPAEGIKNPVITPEDVTDVDANTVADPFMVREGLTWYMFFEVKHAHTRKTSIALATSGDGLRWTYQQIVLAEPFIISFPYVFKWRGQYYMIPETHQAGAVRLYKADGFPTAWSFVKNLIEGVYVDPAIVRYDEKWWLFAAENLGNDKLHLFYSEDLPGPWVEHPKSPVVYGDDRKARPGGRVILHEGQAVRYAQVDHRYYGEAVRAFIIDEMTTAEYREHESEVSPILAGSGSLWGGWAAWNAKGMHTIDPHQVGENRWIACVDGFYKQHCVRAKECFPR